MIQARDQQTEWMTVATAASDLHRQQLFQPPPVVGLRKRIEICRRSDHRLVAPQLPVGPRPLVLEPGKFSIQLQHGLPQRLQALHIALGRHQQPPLRPAVDMALQGVILPIRAGDVQRAPIQQQRAPLVRHQRLYILQVGTDKHRARIPGLASPFRWRHQSQEAAVGGQNATIFVQQRDRDVAAFL